MATIQKTFPTRDDLQSHADKFWSAVTIGGPDECWLWTRKARDGRGYGAFTFKGRILGAHQIAYVLSKGNLDIGQCVRHAECDNPPCCNPAHLKAGTHKQNMEDMAARGRVGTRHGTNNADAKLSDEQVVCLINEYIDGALVSHLSIKYRISCPVVRKILRGLAYKNVPRPGGEMNVYRGPGSGHPRDYLRILDDAAALVGAGT